LRLATCDLHLRTCASATRLTSRSRWMALALIAVGGEWRLWGERCGQVHTRQLVLRFWNYEMAQSRWADAICASVMLMMRCLMGVVSQAPFSSMRRSATLLIAKPMPLKLNWIRWYGGHSSNRSYNRCSGLRHVDRRARTALERRRASTLAIAARCSRMRRS